MRWDFIGNIERSYITVPELGCFWFPLSRKVVENEDQDVKITILISAGTVDISKT